MQHNRLNFIWPHRFKVAAYQKLTFTETSALHHRHKMNKARQDFVFKCLVLGPVGMPLGPGHWALVPPRAQGPGRGTIQISKGISITVALIHRAHGH